MIIPMIVFIAILLISFKMGTVSFYLMSDKNIGYVQGTLIWVFSYVFWLLIVYIPIKIIMTIFYPIWWF